MGCSVVRGHQSRALLQGQEKEEGAGLTSHGPSVFDLKPKEIVPD